MPNGWAGIPLDHPDITRAYLNFTLRCVEAMVRNYLAFGVGLNVLLSHDQPARARGCGEQGPEKRQPTFLGRWVASCVWVSLD